MINSYLDEAGSKVKLTKDQANKIAASVCDEIDASEVAKSNIENRWNRVMDMYRCDPKGSNLHLVDGLQPYTFPLYRQKANAISRTVSGAYFSVKPWAQLVDSSGHQPLDSVERTLQAFLESSNLKNTMSSVLLNMVHFNCGILRVKLCSDGTLEADNVHPQHSMMHPVQVSDYRKLKTMGHRFFLMRFEVEERIESKEYDLDVDVSRIGQVASNETTRDAVYAHSSSVGKDDDEIECWEFCTKLKLKGDTKREWYLGVLEKSSRQLLRLEKLPYSRPWYFVFKTSYDEDNMFPSDSVGNINQGLQLAFNDIFTTLLHGSYMAAFPLAVVSGGMLSNKVAAYQPGQMIESGDDIRLQYIETRFNPGALPAIASKIEELADGVTGISRFGTSQNLPASTTATAASGFLNAQQESKDYYVEIVETTFNEMFEFCFELMHKHSETIAKKMGHRWQILPDSFVDASAFDLQATGGGATTDPRLLGQKLATLQQMAQAPTSQLDPVKVEEKVIETLDLPFDTVALKKAPAPPMPVPGPMGAMPPSGPVGPGVPGPVGPGPVQAPGGMPPIDPAQIMAMMGQGGIPGGVSGGAGPVGPGQPQVNPEELMAMLSQMQGSAGGPPMGEPSQMSPEQLQALMAQIQGGGHSAR